MRCLLAFFDSLFESLIHVCMSRFCQNVCSDSIFCNLWSHAKIWRDVWRMLVTYLFLFTCSDFDEMSDKRFMFRNLWFRNILQWLFHMLKFCRDVLIDNTSRNLWSLLACSWLDFYVSVRTRCFAIDLYFVFDLLKFSTNMCFEMSFIKVLDQKSLRTSNVFSIIWFDLQYVRIDSEVLFIKVFDQKLFFLFFSNLMTRKAIAKLSISFVFVNASVIISEIINFCFTIAHETCDNERIKSFISMSLKTVVNVYFISNFWYASAQSFIDQTREFAHYQYYYIHRRSRLMHNREQQKNHSKNCFFRLL